MEKIKKSAKKSGQKDKVKKGSDFSLRILALVAAIVSWFILSITQYPTVNKTITGVHVDFSLEGTQAQEKGLDALNYKDITVDVEISGMNYEIGNYTDNDLSATVNLDSVTKEGTYKLDIEVKSTHSTDRCTILSVSPETIEVEFDRITTKSFALTAEAPLITAEEGYTLKEVSVSPSEVTIEGPENELENISKVTARISKSQKINEDVTITADDIVFYDADDNKLDDSKLSIVDDSGFNVNFVVYKKKTINFQVDISGCPDNFDVSSLPMQLSEDSISVITPNLEANDTETLYIGTIALSSINLIGSYEFSIPLGTGEINLNGVETVTVSFDSENYTSKDFTIDADRINLINKPSNMQTELETVKLANVTIYGPEDVISKLTDDDITATVNLSDIYEAGSYSRETTITVENYDNVWSYGSNDVQVVVSAQDDSE